VTSVRKRLDHVIEELSNLGSEPNEETANNIATEIEVIKGQYKDSERVPMCCFRFDSKQRVLCDAQGPLELNEFMTGCRNCQEKIKTVLSKLKTD
jgi:hypothetical protein